MLNGGKKGRFGESFQRMELINFSGELKFNRYLASLRT